MNTKLLLTIGIFASFMSCSKDKLNTKPRLELLSTGDFDVPVNGGLGLELKYFDKEGDVSDTLYVKKIRLNKKTTATIRDSFAFQVPVAPMTSVGFLNVSLNYTNLQSAINPGNPPANDTLILKFVLKDKANNKSDTVTTGQIIVHR